MAGPNYVINDLIAVTEKVDLERIRVPITTSTTTTTETTTSERTLASGTPTPKSSRMTPTPKPDTQKRLPLVNNEQKKEQINPQKTTLAVTGIADNSGKFFQYP